jgi:hypothetical protein
MTTTRQPFTRVVTAPAPTARDEPRRFARRVKHWSLALAVGSFGLAWGLVSQNVVGATNVAPAQAPTDAGTTPHRASVPSEDFFGAVGSQPQPIIGGGGSAPAPVVRGRTS